LTLAAFISCSSRRMESLSQRLPLFGTAVRQNGSSSSCGCSHSEEYNAE
jgi:hypothetical protein